MSATPVLTCSALTLANDPLLRFSELERLGYPSVFTLRRRRLDGSLPAVWCGNHWRARRSDVERLYPVRRGGVAVAAEKNSLPADVRAWLDRAPSLSPATSAAVSRLIVEAGVPA